MLPTSHLRMAGVYQDHESAAHAPNESLKHGALLDDQQKSSQGYGRPAILPLIGSQ
jgi:hypothetical protein